MSKKLNIESITNELAGSAFFPHRPETKGGESNLTPLPEKQPERKPVLQSEPQNFPLPERVNARPPVRPNGKRIITRNSFEIYEDQMDALRKLSLGEKMEGKLGSMSEMVREAIDTFLRNKPTVK